MSQNEFNKHVNQFFDYFNKATLLINKDLHGRYLECLEEATKELLEGNYSDKLSEGHQKMLKNIWDEFNTIQFNNEEARLAWEQLIIMALKDQLMPLSVLIPDCMGYFMAILVNELYKDETFSCCDIAMGTGSLLFTLKSYHEEEILALGIEEDSQLIKCAQIGEALQDSSINIYQNPLLKELGIEVDFLLGNLNGYDMNEPIESNLYSLGVRYMPYLMIERRLDNLREKGHFCFIVPTNFFSQSSIELFQAMFKDQATLDAVIILPEGLFKNKSDGKLLIVGTKVPSYNSNGEHLSTDILTIKGLDAPSLNDARQMLRGLAQAIKEEYHENFSD